MPQATITNVDSGRIQVLVRRSARYEYLYRRWYEPEFVVGAKVEVKRQTNNPYPVLVRILD